MIRTAAITQVVKDERATVSEALEVIEQINRVGDNDRLRATGLLFPLQSFQRFDRVDELRIDLEGLFVVGDGQRSIVRKPACG